MTAPSVQLHRNWVGRCFVHPLVDYLLIGGVLSLIVIPTLYKVSSGVLMTDVELLPWFFLFSNSAHFASSTIRLYSKEGTRESLPFLTMALPLVTLVVLTLGIFFANNIGAWIQAIYLAWSPYHYTAQAYGLAVMYCYRSGFKLSKFEKRMLFLVALPPFIKVLLVTFQQTIIPWFAPAELVWVEDGISSWLTMPSKVIGILGLVLPAMLFVWLWKRHGKPIPLISLLVILTNAIWFVVFPLIEGVVWATVFHGIQYLAIVLIFHVRDRLSDPANKHGVVWHVMWFYGMCLALGYAMFNCMPFGFVAIGFGQAESVLLVVAAINIHHFIVDGYIWKLGRNDANAKIVEASPEY